MGSHSTEAEQEVEAEPEVDLGVVEGFVEEAPRGVLAEARPLNEGFPPLKDRDPQSSQIPQPVLSSTGPVGARLSHYWRAWRDLGASDWVVSVLRWGYALEFLL
mgnify:CR=1 FL=1